MWPQSPEHFQGFPLFHALPHTVGLFLVSVLMIRHLTRPWNIKENSKAIRVLFFLLKVGSTNLYPLCLQMRSSKVLLGIMVGWGLTFVVWFFLLAFKSFFLGELSPQHVIRAQRAINNEMAHQLYVLQVLTFNLLEDRMMTKMDPQDQVGAH